MKRDFNKSDRSDAQVGSAESNLSHVTETQVEAPAVNAYDGKTADNTVPADRGVIKKNDTPDPHRIKTTEAARVAKSSGSMVGGGASLMRAVTYGGGVASVSQDASATTRVSKPYKSGTREGKRNDAIARNVDFNYPQLVETDRRESKPLAETDKKQGYNGNYYNDHARTQRASGGAPGDPMFERSLEEISMDMVYFTDGQYNTARSGYGEYDIHSYDVANHEYSKAVIGESRGNYVAKEIQVKFNSQGAVGITFVETDMANRNLDEITAQTAGDAALRTANQRELDRLRIVATAGDENDLNYSPLGDQIVDATAVNTYLADLEGLAGDFAYMSARKLQHALSYQLNKAALDGVRLQGPMAEMTNGLLEGSLSAALAAKDEFSGLSEWRNPTAWANGGSGLFVALHDSLGKYTTKAKLLSMPLSFRNCVTTGKNNMGPLRAHETFVKDVAKSELFSTIDGPYDPFMPVCVTNCASLVYPVSMQAAASKINYAADMTAANNGMSPQFNIFYGTLRNKTVVPVYNFFVKGLFEYFKAYAYKFRTLLPGESDAEKTLRIPVISSTTSISAWDCLVMDAMPFIVRERERVLNATVIKYQNVFQYPYTGLVDLASVDVTAAMNFQFSDVDSPLVTKVASPVDSMKVRLPEIFWVVDASTMRAATDGVNQEYRIARTVLPHYFCQNQFKAGDGGLLSLSDEASTMCYPSQRSGATLSYMDVIYGMDEEDYRLCLDRMVTYPGAIRAKAGVWENGNDDTQPVVVDADYTQPANASLPTVYKYGFTTDGQPCIPYICAANDADYKGYCLSILDVMRTPREMGLHFVAPAGVLTPYSVSGEANRRDVSSGYLAYSGPGFCAKAWHIQAKQPQSAILGAENVAYDPNESYTYSWELFQPTPFSPNFDQGYVLGISRGMKAGATAHTYTLDGGSFDMAPFAFGGFDPEYEFDSALYPNEEVQVAVQSSATNYAYQVLSFQKYFWTRLQRLPFILNPFDANASDVTYAASGAYLGNKFDIFDLLYYLGLAGFRASDYTQLQFERVKQRTTMGLNYVSDPYLSKSLLLA